MTCPTCSAPMTPDKWGESRTLVGYSSPPGHNHDDNCRKRTYECPNGHHIIVSKRNRCSTPGCDWVGKPDCFCHPDPKVEEWPE